ncbi:MAG: RNA 2',3'-cyclic phosphodiesterase, partial [Patescibacteria group bacterium]|nr:RNA 2',3'-cyclic phosphodiesterase [Patescibacteria group bacterium]
LLIMKQIRTFFAIPLPDQIKFEMSRIQKYFSKYDAPIKWINPTNMHITIKFLGNTNITLLSETETELKTRFKEFSRFKLKLSYNGYFPSRGKPRVLWTGMKEIPRQTKQIFYFLNSYFTKYSYDESGRKLSPHITQARTKGRVDRNLIRRFKLFQVEPIEFNVDKIVWFESTHINNVLTYIPLREFLLK